MVHGLKSALLAGGSLMLCSGAAMAQTSPSASPSAADAGALPAQQEIVVVGSHIRGAKTTGALPVTVVGQQEILATAAVSGDELFRSIPQAGDVQFQSSRTTGNLNDARGDIASINLRSLGTGNTLVLLNGRRLNFAPGSQTENFVPVLTVNTNSIPVAGVSRIEVLRDGAAAIYGTDAVAGVVNIVLDDKFQGLQMGAQYGGADHYEEGSLTVKAGTTTADGTRLSLFAGYTNHTSLMASDRDFSMSEDHRNVGQDPLFAADTAFDNRSTSSPWGAFTVVPSSTVVRQNGVALTSSGVFHVEPTSNTAAGCSSTVYGSALCLKSGGITGTADRVLRYDEGSDRTLLGNVDRYNLFGTATHDFGAVEGFAEAGYYHALFDGQREQSAPLSTAPITIAANAYWNPFGPTGSPNRLAGLTGVPTTGLAMTITNYRPVDTGPRTYSVTDDSVRVLGGLRGDAYGFHWESALSYNWARTDDVTHNAISNTLFQQAINRTDSSAYNPFNGGNLANYSRGDSTPNSPATINSFLINVDRTGYTSLTTWDFKASKNDLFRLPAGDVGLAFGGEVRHETYEDDRDPRLNGTIKYTDSVTGITYGTDVVGASPSPNVNADRTVSSFYAELAIPVISPSMNIPLVQSIDLQLAARDEYYSDFGNVAKPKFAGIWKVTDWVSIRGSYSEGFRAPNLPQFYSDGTTVSNSRTDYAFCRINNTTCSSLSTIEVRSGNKDLKPEDAKESSVGFIFQPTFIPSRYGKLTATIDLWDINETNVIGIEDAPTQILYDLLLRLNGSSNPNVVRLAPASGQKVGLISYVNELYTNLQPRELSGIDYTVDYSLKGTRWGNFSVLLNAAQLTKFQQSPDAIQSQVIAANKAGLFGPNVTVTSAGNQIKINDNPRWRASATFTWSQGPWQVGAFYSYTGPVFDTGPVQENSQYFKVKEWLTSSYYVQYRIDSHDWASGTTLRLGVRNLENKDPPLASTNVGYEGQIENPLGRYWYGSITKRF
jgi:outer membrane receptor protein involved in Fe transport